MAFIVHRSANIGLLRRRRQIVVMSSCGDAAALHKIDAATVLNYRKILWIKSGEIAARQAAARRA
ncbi:MAG: hypothetical protein WD871_04665 [Xanthobacteraceae bacterium]